MNQQSSIATKKYKRPESVLVVIVAKDTGRFLMLQRTDDRYFWQSVTGSLEEGETPIQAARREIEEELGIDFNQIEGQLLDNHYSVDFEIFPQFRYRYAPNVSHCHEHWFRFEIKQEFTPHLSEHVAFKWLEAHQAASLTKSWNNRQAILDLIQQ